MPCGTDTEAALRKMVGVFIGGFEFGKIAGWVQPGSLPRRAGRWPEATGRRQSEWKSWLGEPGFELLVEVGDRRVHVQASVFHAVEDGEAGL